MQTPVESGFSDQGQRGSAAARPLVEARSYRELFDALAHGVAVVEPHWSDEDRLTDYTILDANPALREMLGLRPCMVGLKLSQTRYWNLPWLKTCEKVLRTGQTRKVEFDHARSGRIYEITVTPLAEGRLTQVYVDITERKREQARTAMLASELNHRVKNNLAVVAGLLQMQAKASSEAREPLMQAADRIHAVAAVHASLSRDGVRKTLNFGDYLRRLCLGLTQSLLDDRRVGLVVEAEDIDVSGDLALALGLIVNELVTNAAKHAYPTPWTGDICVSFQQVAGELRLRVSDDGAGLALEATPGAGLGMGIVRLMAEQVGGRLEADPGPGAAFTLTLPSPAARLN